MSPRDRRGGKVKYNAEEKNGIHALRRKKQKKQAGRARRKRRRIRRGRRK